jgi:site-specific DNA recombinase
MPIIARHIRVSTRDQRDKGALDKMRFFVDAAALEIGGELIEDLLWVDVESAYKRSEALYNTLIQRLEQFKPDVLVCYRIDRSMRNVRYAMQLQEHLALCKVKLYVVQDGRYFDFDNPADWKSYADQAVSAESESRQTSARVKKAYQYRESEGMPSLKAPWGWAVVDNTYVCTHPADVRWAFNRFLSHQSTGQMRSDFVERFGKTWNVNGLQYWLSHPIHAGHTGYGRYSKSWRKVVYNTHQSIISNDERDRVLQIFTENKKYWGVLATMARHPLSGLVRCAECGSSMIRVTSGNRAARYYCRNKIACSMRRSPLESDLEALLIASLVNAAGKIAKISAVPSMEKPPLLIEQERLLEGLRGLGNDAAIELARASIQGKIEAIKASMDAPTFPNLDLLKANFSDPLIWSVATQQEKRYIYHALCSQIQVSQDSVHVQLAYGLSS